MKLTMDTSSIGELFLLLFKSRQNFYCHVTKYDASFVLQTFRERQKSLHGYLPKKFNNFVIIKNNTVLLSSFM